MNEWCCDFDEALSQIKDLTWFPWVGNAYQQANRKILVLGESHYCYNNYTQDNIEQNRLETRECVTDYVERGRAAGNQWKTYEPLEAVLRGTVQKDRDRKQIWSEIAYMNIIQKCMLDKQTRPHWELFLFGWKSVLQVIYAINPDICICFGTAERTTRCNFNRLEEFRDVVAFSYSIEKNSNTGERISNCKVATPGKVIFKQWDVPVIFVQHPSRMKSSIPQWIEVIDRYI